MTTSQVPDSEAYWMANLDLKNLKLYRKTSTGRYKEIDKSRLKEIWGVDIKKTTALSETKDTQEVVPQSKPTLQSLSIPTILLQNMTSYPFTPGDVWKHSGEENNPGQAWDKPGVVKYPSVTRVLSETMSESAKKALEKWKMNLIEELGEEGFMLHQKELLQNGAIFHDTIRRHLELRDVQKAPEALAPSLEGCWKSVSPVLAELTDIRVLEGRVAHPVLLYKGIIDCIASYRGTPYAIEWKKSDKQKPTLSATYDAPLQLSAYMGALPPLPRPSGPPTHNGMVVVCYTDGSPAHTYPMDTATCSSYWKLWLIRLQNYWSVFRKLN